MIVKDTLPNATGSPLNQKYLDLSQEEKEEVKQIIDRLRIIFEATSVDMRMTECSLNSASYVIEINDSPIGKVL